MNMDTEKILSQLTLEEKASLCSGRDFWHTKAVERLGVPSAMMCDGPHGLRKQTGAGDHLGITESIETTCYPTASALASGFDRQLLTRLGTALGRECRAEGVAMLLGPGINIKRSPLCGRNFEYFSEDPFLAGELAVSYIAGLQAEGVSACVKHFAANNQETRRMSGSSQLDERTLHEIYLPAFEAAVKKGGVRSVMCAYNAINGTFAAENRALLTGILREKWGFDGFVVTDWGAVKDRVKGLAAGVDLEMPGGPGAQDAQIVQAVRDGRLDEALLDQAVRRMLRFAASAAEPCVPVSAAARAARSDLSKELAEQCAVLLKNEGGALPLDADAPVALIGAFANEPRCQGAGSSHIHVRHTVSAREAAAGKSVTYAQGYALHGDGQESRLTAEAVSAAKASRAAVVFAGLPEEFETEGCDRNTLSLPDNQNRLIAAVAAANPNTIVVLHGGAPMTLPWLGSVRAVLCMYLGGEQVGAAAIRLLYGEENPSGRLAETWPCKLADNPSFLNFPGEDGVAQYAEGIYVGYRYYDKKQMDVQFPFGYGLSYTQFRLSGLTLDRTAFLDTDVLTVTCRVKNIGARPGREVVQLYVREDAPAVRRPVRELKGFEKVLLAPGEEKEVTFTLDKRAFAWYEPKIQDWFVKSGRFWVEIGVSSRDIRLCAPVEVTGTAELPFHFTGRSIVADLERTAAGRAFLRQMTAGRADAAAEKDGAKDDPMGAGSKKMMDAMMREMPLCALVTYGAMTAPQLDGLLAMLNKKV